MMPDFLFTIEDPDNPLAVSVYKHPDTQETMFWLKMGRGVLEISNTETLDNLIEILQYTKQEIQEEKYE